MANSDNVVRAGLTPKFKDVDVLTEMLTFETGKEWIFKGQEASEGRMLFKPPVGEFAVEVIEVRS
jgi:mannose-6-phosphate isomerase